MIAAVLIRHGFGEFISRLNLQDNFISRMLGRKSHVQSDHLSMPQRISLVMQDLGPTFIKLGQILSTRPDLIPEEYIEEFKKLQTKASPVDFHIIAAQIEKSLKRPIEQLFSHIEREPLASASIAQVHAARLLDGTEVVVKVQRPEIRDILRSDLSILIFLARRVAQLFPSIELIDPVGIAEEFEKAISKELDFNVELRNIERFAHNFPDEPTLHIPRVYRELSCNTVIVMERLYGVKVTEVTQGKKLIVQRMLKIVFDMIYVHSFFHGDLHPGNILVERDGRIGLIDFGLVGRLTPLMREQVTDLIMGLIRFDYEAVAEVLYDLGIKRTPVNYERFLSDVVTLMDEHLLGVTMAEMEFGRLFQDLLEGAIRHKIAIPPDYTMMFKALITAEGVGKQLYPELDILRELEPYVLELVKKRYHPRSVAKKGLHYFNSFLRLFKQFPITARQVLMAIENGRIQFGFDRSQFDDIMREYRQHHTRTLQATIACVFMLSATLALHHGSPFLFGIPTLSFLGYLLGVSLSLWILLDTFRRK